MWLKFLKKQQVADGQLEFELRLRYFSKTLTANSSLLNEKLSCQRWLTLRKTQEVQFQVEARTSRLQIFFIKDVLKNFHNVYRKTTLVESFIITGRQEARNFIQERLQRSSFPVNFSKFLRVTILGNTYQRQLLSKLLKRLVLPAIYGEMQ